LRGFPSERSFLTPSLIYTKGVLAVTRECDVKAAAHVTVGGITDNLPRVLPRI